MADLMKQIEQLSPRKRALLEILQRERGLPHGTPTEVSGPPSADRWIAYHTPNPQAHIRLFCLPYAGAGASIYRTWAETIGPQIEVYPIQLPGSEQRAAERPIEQASTLVALLAQVLVPYLTLPFAFFGYSMGALMSFELARHLCGQGAPTPVHLFVAAYEAPRRFRSGREIPRLSDAELFERLRHLNGVPPELMAHPDLLDLMLPKLRADRAICESYSYLPGVPLDCPITAFGGISDPMVSQESLLEWSRETSGPFDLHMLPGDHFFLHTNTQTIIKSVNKALIAGITP